ncbi:uncharacterized protein LOC113464177 [Ceratina calcarata]|uniref:Uncharacterized protein LOC113464177 n=1 Tax=Ceratina calcarata TaxID=156304 RepID=A0AAJ7RYU2_9HYME|nr:uncharacterized protein LOC113464177 [Ceratina calcarata]
MDLQSAELGTRAGQAVHPAADLSWLDWQLPLFIALCAISGAILFTFLALLWLRRQMSREKDREDGDRRGLVEEGAVGHAEKSVKPAATSIEWVHSKKPSAPSARPVQASGLPEVSAITSVLT